jgi:putative transcriptional regulator
MEVRRKLKSRLLKLLLEKSNREERRITQTELAQAIKVSNNTISHLLNDELKKLDIGVIERLCEYFDCDINDLLYLEAITDESPENE